MGDVLTLIEKAEQTFDEKKAKEIEQKMRSATFDLEDFLDQLQQVKKLGSISQIAEMIPGISKLARQAPSEVDDSKVKKIEAIIQSMTPAERHNPAMIDGSRRRRIARGSGTTPQDVNQLLNQFRQTQKLLKQIDSKKVFNPMALFK
jgi:signal recognition particle subunit SRP54